MKHEQQVLWNGPAGHAWVAAQTLLDAMFEPFEAMLVHAAGSAHRVLDVGCGTGATTLALARATDARSCVGIDISEPMIAVARQRAGGEAAEFICADAATHAFAPATFDAIVSRFGVMFFDDPVAAFTNLRAAASPDAVLSCIAWRSAAENPFMTTAERVAAPLLPGLPQRRPEGPGQFAFANADRVRCMLADSGWYDVRMLPLDVACSFPASDLTRYFTLLGPVGLALQQADAATREQVAGVVRAAFDPFVDGDTVRFDAACWQITARSLR